jgi:hypothetical protein
MKVVKFDEAILVNIIGIKEVIDLLRKKVCHDHAVFTPAY